MKTTKPFIAPLLLGAALVVAAAAVPAAHRGARHHAEGQYNAATSTYRVVAGDNLSAIAERFGVTVAKLMDANKLRSNAVEIGQKLVISAAGATTTAPAAAASQGAQHEASTLAAASAPPNPEQTTGVPGSPDATTTIDGRYIPPPPQPFQGVIKLNALQSKPAWPARVVPPKGAPNILLIMTDDVGFGAPSTFGGVIPTPTLDRIAKNGLRYAAAHTPPMPNRLLKLAEAHW